MSNNIPGVHASNPFNSVSKFFKKSSVTPKVLIIYEKHFFKLIPKSISKFPKV